MRATATKDIKVLRADNLSRLDWVIHGFSTRRGGTSKCYGGGALNLGVTGEDDRGAVQRNRQAFLEAVGATGYPLVLLKQVHSDVVHVIARPPQGTGRRLLVGDGLLTAAAGVVLGIQTADCLPLLLTDTRQRVVAILHAGWRGTVARVAYKGVAAMDENFGSRPQDILAAIGPGIHRCCYELGEEVRRKFREQFAYTDELFEEAGPRPHLDLVEANRRQLLEAGLSADAVSASELCTSCRTDLFFSHRAEKGVTGRMLAVIGIRKD